MKLRKLLALLVALTLLAAVPVAAAVEEEPAGTEAAEEYPVARFDDRCDVRGNVDGDNRVTAGDARAALRLAVELDEADAYTKVAADFDWDGSITAADARAILRVAVGLFAGPAHLDGTGLVTAKAPTCTEDGMTGRRCEICKRWYDTKTVWSLEHKPGGWVTIKPATCREFGEMARLCLTCGEAIETKVLPKLEHEYDTLHPIYVDPHPDCTKVQTVEYACLTCGERIQSLLTGYRTHDYQWEQVLDPTCTTEGLRIYRCTRCGKNDPTVLPELLPTLGGHTPVWVTETQPTPEMPGHQIYRCTKCKTVLDETDILFEPGEHRFDLRHPAFTEENPDCTVISTVVYTCLDCGETRTSLRLPSAAHKNEWTETLAPTCTEAGRQSEACAVCGKPSGAKDKEVPKLGHDPVWTVEVPAVGDKEGLGVKTCRRCGITMDTRVIPAVTEHVHTYDRLHPIFLGENPDCTRTQTVQYRCTGCGETIQEVFIGNAEHPYGWVRVSEPTCANDGVELKRCTLCGKDAPGLNTRTVLALGHAPEWRVLYQPKDDKPGIEIYICTRCGDVLDAREF